MASIFAVKAGATKVIFVDMEPRLTFVKSHWPAIHADKLELVDYKKLSFGVTNKPTVVSKLKDLCGGRGPDAAIECAARDEIVNEMIEGVRAFGRCGVTGIYVGYTNHFNIRSLMERGIRLIGNGQAPVHKYWEELLKMIQSGELDPLQMVSHRVHIEDLEKVYSMFEKREDNMQKVFVETKFSLPACAGSPALTRY
ncbi:hypothetical protein F4781DRAFT_443777 [Annulohypoxylon bovei var. microspora]|nr:hypothetical protein F4781DRAFT_443777 [Annulohypoxylon bovei var. microspora]